MVCMESIITTSGIVFLITSSITSRFVSQSSDSLSENSPILSARSLICLSDSSPDMYNTFFDSARLRHTCKRSVDFPIPGSPPTSTSEPLTIPPPSTLSSSEYPVSVLSSSSSDIPDRTDGMTSRCAIPLIFPCTVCFTTGSSTKVFHCLHSGHCPSHFEDSYPHSLQKKAVFLAFAILTSFLNKQGCPTLIAIVQPCHFI